MGSSGGGVGLGGVGLPLGWVGWVRDVGGLPSSTTVATHSGKVDRK